MKQFILDASVAVKWFFDEPDWEKAGLYLDRLSRGEIEIIVPEFFYLEVANTCWVKVVKGASTLQRSIEVFDRVLELPLKFYPERELSDVALENALRFHISAYDGVYLALSEIYVAPLITADKDLYEKCRKRFDFIEYLGNVRLN